MAVAVDVCKFEAATSKWRDIITGEYFPDPPPVAPSGVVLYAPDVLTEWDKTNVVPNTATSAYTRLVNRVTSKWGGLSKTIVDQGSGTLNGLVTAETGGWRDDALYGKCAAVIGKAAENSGDLATRDAWWGKAREVLYAVKDCRDIQYGPGRSTFNDGQQKLELSWAVPAWCETAWIIGFASDPGNAAFCAFLDSVYNRLLWRTGNNWVATMANSRISIANYRQSPTKLADAISFGEFYLARGAYHSTYDGANIKPVVNVWWDDPNILTAPGNSGGTASHWYNSVTSSSPWTARDPRSGWTFENGVMPEFRRDWNHDAMALVGFMNWARNIRVAGLPVPAHAHARIREAVRFFAKRVLYIIDNNGGGGSYAAGTELPGIPTFDRGGSGTPDRTYSHAVMWPYIAKTYLGSEAPADVDTLLNRSRIYNATEVAGWNAVAAEQMAEGSLL